MPDYNAALTRYVSSMTGLLSQLIPATDQPCSFKVDNNDGQFSVSQNVGIVTEVPIIDNADDLAVVQSSGLTEVIADARDRSVWVLLNAVWSVSATVQYGDIVPRGHVVVNLITKKAFWVDKSLVLRRITMTPQEPVVLPGPTDLIGGDTQRGYYGIVPASDFITGDELATELGLTYGVSQFSDSDWLKFAYKGKTLFIPMKTIRHGLSWDELESENLVFGNRTVVVDDLNYTIRLMKGAGSDPTPWIETIGYYDPLESVGSEWNDLIYPVHVEDPTATNWAAFTDEDIHVTTEYGSGGSTLCQETITSDSTRKILRGAYGLTYFTANAANNNNIHRGWRPVLERNG